MVVRDGEDKDLPFKAISFFFWSLLFRFLLNPKKGFDCNAAAVHIPSIGYVKTATLYLAQCA